MKKIAILFSLVFIALLYSCGGKKSYKCSFPGKRMNADAWERMPDEQTLTKKDKETDAEFKARVDYFVSQDYTCR